MSVSGLKNSQFLEEKVAELLEVITSQKQEIAWLKKQVFGPKKEKVDPHQLNLDFLPEVETPPPFVDEAPDDETPPAKKKKSRRNGRAPLPEDLPRQRIEHHPEPEDLICSCCAAEKTRIGEEVTEELDYVPEESPPKDLLEGGGDATSPVTKGLCGKEGLVGARGFEPPTF